MVEIPIVVVTINSEIHLGAWLQSVKILALPEGVQAYPYIVDNGSWDGTPGIIWDAVRDGTVDSNNVVWLNENTGFNRAQNLAFRHLGTRRNVAYVATLNHDATTDREWLRNLYTAASDAVALDRVGMWGGPIRRPDCRDRISSAGHAIRSRDGAFLDIDWNLPITGGQEKRVRSWILYHLKFKARPQPSLVYHLNYPQVDLSARNRISSRWRLEV